MRWRSTKPPLLAATASELARNRPCSAWKQPSSAAARPWRASRSGPSKWQMRRSRQCTTSIRGGATPMPRTAAGSKKANVANGTKVSQSCDPRASNRPRTSSKRKMGSSTADPTRPATTWPLGAGPDGGQRTLHSAKCFNNLRCKWVTAPAQSSTLSCPAWCRNSWSANPPKHTTRQLERHSATTNGKSPKAEALAMPTRLRQKSQKRDVRACRATSIKASLCKAARRRWEACKLIRRTVQIREALVGHLLHISSRAVGLPPSTKDCGSACSCVLDCRRRGRSADDEEEDVAGSLPAPFLAAAKASSRACVSTAARQRVLTRGASRCGGNSEKLQPPDSSLRLPVSCRRPAW
mmetsp:Transcript_54077/g.161151  ORF Transcript_54077/g.161151 Transcript_54077/m.161151 type:complete len:352 (-) Transcript_54077:895-1950(-)